MLFITALTSAAIAQCDYAINKTDPFTKTKKVVTHSRKVFDLFKRLDLAWTKTNDNLYMTCYVNISGSGLVFAENSTAIFLMDDESTVTLNYFCESGKIISTGNTTYSNGQAHTSYNLLFYITPDDVAKMKNSMLKAVRFYGSETYIEFQIKNKKKNIQRNLQSFFVKDWICVNK